jgi:hypothetical protein
MAHAPEALERAEHAAHSGHDSHGGRLTTWVGITMAILGVLLAFTAAKVGGERAELMMALVDQQHAHAKYQAQDVKHRAAVLSLRQLHATAVGSKVDPLDMRTVAGTVNRYFAESAAARAWVDAYDPLIAAHIEGQEEYELAQLAAEIGIVIASIALLLRRRAPWLVAVALGCAAVGQTAMTWRHERVLVHQLEARTEETGKVYRALRDAGKTEDIDQALVDEVLTTYGEPVKTR